MHVGSRTIAAAVFALGLNGCVTDSDSNKWLPSFTADNTASSGKSEAPTNLPRCAAPVATVALIEQPIDDLVTHGLSTPLPLLRLMVQKSNCLSVVERGKGFSQAEDERSLAEKGYLRANSRMTKGQMIAADFAIAPTIDFVKSDGRGFGGGLLSAIPIPGLERLRPAVDSLNFEQAQVVLLLTNNRTGEQVAASEGSASQVDLGEGMALLDTLKADDKDDYLRTPQGRAVAAAMLNAFANMITRIQEIKGVG